ncbi:MAG: PASTA domain-containing protein [Thermoleophilia bacterium]
MAAVLLAIGSGVAGCGGGGSGTTVQAVTVPNVVGLAPLTAIDRLCAAQLQLGTVQEQHHSTVIGRTRGRGHVISTQPIAATRVAAGTVVDVVIWTPANSATAYQYRCGTGRSTTGN